MTQYKEGTKYTDAILDELAELRGKVSLYYTELSVLRGFSSSIQAALAKFMRGDPQTFIEECLNALVAVELHSKYGESDTSMRDRISAAKALEEVSAEVSARYAFPANFLYSAGISASKDVRQTAESLCYGMLSAVKATGAQLVVDRNCNLFVITDAQKLDRGDVVLRKLTGALTVHSQDGAGSFAVSAEDFRDYYLRLPVSC